jgi:hypothetical protein
LTFVVVHFVFGMLAAHDDGFVVFCYCFFFLNVRVDMFLGKLAKSLNWKYIKITMCAAAIGLNPKILGLGSCPLEGAAVPWEKLPLDDSQCHEIPCHSHMIPMHHGTCIRHLWCISSK